jgi:cell division protein DivIC
LKKAGVFRLKKMVVIGFCLYAVLTLVKQEFEIRKLEQKKVEKQVQLEKLESEAAEIRKNIDNKEDIKYIEKIARDELNMVRPNEIIYEDENASKTEKKPNKE